MAEQVLTLPFTSVTVNVTIFAPRSAQVNVESLTTIVAIPQLSNDPLLTLCVDIVLVKCVSSLPASLKIGSIAKSIRSPTATSRLNE